MSGEEGRGVSNAALKIEIKGLGDRIDDVKHLLVAYEERIRCLERAGDKTTPVIEKRIEILENTTKQHEKDIKDLTALINTQAKSIEELKDSVNMMKTISKWFLGVFTAVMIAMIILLVTGQALVVFK